MPILPLPGWGGLGLRAGCLDAGDDLLVDRARFGLGLGVGRGLELHVSADLPADGLRGARDPHTSTE